VNYDYCADSTFARQPTESAVVVAAAALAVVMALNLQIRKP
jgi:hypothetical protein